ncbi:ABC transporter permease [bacterium]|nr:ABC transporter permease [bacterium]
MRREPIIMKTLRILSRSLRDSLKSVFRNFSLSMASISCITITLLVVALSLILTSNVENIATLIEKDVTIVAFLDVNTTEEERDQVLKDIKSLDNIDSVTFESKVQIANEMMDSSDVFKNVMEGWTEEENPLQDTYLVKVKNIEQINDTANKIQKLDHVSLIKYGEGMVEQLIEVFRLVRNVCVGIVIALVIVTAFLIANTIKITIYSRRREIEIMRLVGASNTNIKIPFILEGLFLGILGSIIPVVATMYTYSILYDKFGGKLFSDLIRLVEPTPFIYEVSGILILIGILVGMFGSWRAVKKYLKI